jgi:3-methyladenine DNA glycosylase AlkD
MQLIREHWQEADIQEFLAYLRSLGKGEEKALWEQRILNTAMPCLAVPATEVKRIVRQIAKGNVREFVRQWCWDNYTASAILGQLICRLPFDEGRDYLLRYAERTDTWAGTDCLTFDRATPEEYMHFAGECLTDSHTFVRRLGVIIMLKLLSPATVDEILSLLPSMQGETEYYVNMAVAWLIADCVVKCRDQALTFLEQGQYNAFVSRKAVSKCRDSYRVSAEDKEMLLRYRK